MEKILVRKVEVPMGQILLFEALMRTNNISVRVIYGAKNAIVEFNNESDYLAFILKDILIRVREESGMYNFAQTDFDFMVRLEKKCKTYNKGDEYFIRKALKGK